MKFLLLVIISLFLSFNFVAAEESKPALLQELEYESVNPGSPYYIFKRLTENLKLKFQYRDQESKAKYYSELLEIRFKELAYTVLEGRYGILENVSSRYMTTLNTMETDFIDENSQFKDRANRYLESLAYLRDKYPANSAQWLLLQQAIDTTKKLSE